PHAHQTRELRGANRTACSRASWLPDTTSEVKCMTSGDSPGSLVSGGPELDSEMFDDTPKD
ncbi:MAG: hypothetical protein RLZZ199_1517, partial [Actinomycetota bacterium]